MAAAACADRNDPVNACLRRLFGKADRGRVVEMQNARIVDERRIHGGIADGGHDDAHSIAAADLKMGLHLLHAEGG